MRASAAWLLLLAAGCGRAEPEPAAAEDIERVAIARKEEPDPLASARPAPLNRADLAAQGVEGAGCEFRSEDGALLLAVAGAGALVRAGGELRHMVSSAPVAESGGFFEDRSLSVSVGRTGERGTALDGGESWPARIAVTNRRTGVQVRLDGRWSCGG